MRLRWYQILFPVVGGWTALAIGAEPASQAPDRQSLDSMTHVKTQELTRRNQELMDHIVASDKALREMDAVIAADRAALSKHIKHLISARDEMGKKLAANKLQNRSLAVQVDELEQELDSVRTARYESESRAAKAQAAALEAMSRTDVANAKASSAAKRIHTLEMALASFENVRDENAALPENRKQP